MMLAYASRTGTRRNLDALRLAGWGLLLSPTGCLRDEGFGDLMLDDGAYTAWRLWLEGKRPTPLLDLGRFAAALRTWGRRVSRVVVPDIVGGGRESLALSLEWLPRVLDQAEHALVAVQDGMVADDIAHLLGPRVGIFVGGTTDGPRPWKLVTLPTWCELGRRTGAWVHVGRVNTAKRIRLCNDFGADSFDGSSASRFAVTLPPLDRARLRLDLWGKGEPT